MRTLPALAVAALLAAPAAAGAQGYRAPSYGLRDTWYIGFGLGTGRGSFSAEGERFSFRDAHAGSPTQVALQLEAGVTVSPRLLLGGELSFLASGSDVGGFESTLSTGQVLGVLTWFPMEQGLFLRGGAGLASLNLEQDDGVVRSTVDVSGLGLMGGVGYAWWLGQRFNLTFHADLNVHAYAHEAGEPASSTALTGYLGFRWY